MKASTKWGIICGAASGLWTLTILILSVYGVSAGDSGMIPGWIFFFAGIYMSILHTRTELEGYIDMANAFRAGLKTSTFGGVIWNACSLLFYVGASKATLAKINPTLTDIQVESMKTVMVQAQMFIVGSVATILIGSFVAIILSFLLKKNPEQEDPAA